MVFIPLLYKMSFFCSKRESINFIFPVLCVSRRLYQVLCLSTVGTLIGSNIVSVRRNSIKVLWCFLYTVLFWETNANLIVSKHQRRRIICFKEIVTPDHETWHPPSLTNLIVSYNFLFFLCNFFFLSSYCFCVFANKFVFVLTHN